MALTLPATPPARPVDAELTAALEPGTGTDLADPRRPLRAVLRARFGQVESLRTLTVALVDAVTAVDTALAAKANASSLAAKADSASLATVATSGAYGDLTAKPTIPTTAAAIGAAPAVHTHTASQISDATTTGQALLKVADAAAARTAVGAAAAVHTHLAADVSDATAVGRSLLKAADAPTARTALGITGTGQVVSILTQAQYAALATKDPNTLYQVTP